MRPDPSKIARVSSTAMLLVVLAGVCACQDDQPAGDLVDEDNGQVTSHDHDERYYSKSESDALLAGKAERQHEHTGSYAPLNHEHALSSLADVTITAPSPGQVLTYDGTTWKASHPSQNPIVESAEALINVKSWGATGDGLTDDTAAVQAAFDSIQQRGGVVFPAGVYRLSNAISVQDKNIGIFGAGSTVSVLRFSAEAADQGLAISWTGAGTSGCTIRDLAILTEKPGQGTAIDLSNAAPDTQDNVHLVNIVFSDPFNGNSKPGGWFDCIRISGLTDGTIRDCECRGAHGSSVTEESSFYTNSLVRFWGEKSMRWTIDDNHVGYVKHAIAIDAGANTEGLFFSGNNWVGVWDGIYDQSGGGTQINFSNNHIHAFRHCLYLTRYNLALISGNLLFGDSRNQQNGSCKHIYLGSGSDAGIITANQFSGPGGQYYDAVHLDGARNTIVSQNIFFSAYRAIYLSGDAQGNQYNGNRFLNVYGARVVNGSTGSQIAWDGAFTTVLRTTSQAVASGQPTDILWSDSSQDDLRLWSTQTSQLVLPSGIKSIRVTAQLRWQTLDSGTILVRILHNDEEIGSLVQKSAGTTDTSLVSPPTRVSAGDGIRVQVQHDSGGMRNVDLAILTIEALARENQ